MLKNDEMDHMFYKERGQEPTTRPASSYPHRLAKHTRLLLFHKVGRRFKARHAEHGGAKAKEERRPDRAVDRIPHKVNVGVRRVAVVGPDDLWVLDREDQARDAQDGQRRDVEDKDRRGHDRRLVDADEHEQRKRAEDRDGRADNRRRGDRHGQVVGRRDGRHDRRRHVAENAQTRRDGRKAFRRRVEQDVVAPAVERNRRHHLFVHEAIHVQDERHDRKRDGGQRPRLEGDNRRRITAARHDVVAAHGGGHPLPKEMLGALERVLDRRQFVVGDFHRFVGAELVLVVEMTETLVVLDWDL